MLIVKGLSVERIDPDCGHHDSCHLFPSWRYPLQLCNSLLHNCRQRSGEVLRLTRHDSAPGPIGYKNLVSNWCQTAPYLPVLPTQPAYNHLSVNNLRFIRFHGMEEVIGSIPIRSTNNPIKMTHFHTQTSF
jgi:hypothetical protein